AGLLEGLGSELAELARPVNVMRVLPVTVPPEGAVKELALADGTGLVWSVALGAERRESGAAVERAGDGGRGWLVVFAFAPELRWTDLPVKPLMVPLVQEIVRQGVGSGASGRVVTAGSVASVPAPAVALRQRGMAGEGAAAGGGGEVLVTDVGVTASPMRNAGVWDAVDASRVARGVVVVNADADGGDVTRQPEESVGAWLSRALPAGQAEWVNVLGESGGAASPGGGGDAVSLTGALSRSAVPRAAGAWLMAIALMLAVVEMLAAWWATPKG
ncbi:MAG: hypothetical protein JNK35_03915, partial [Phycisphaerae bacterium]|nr:hypothetical protein [Phycisphaerae bacterium]